jgi:hypothetical protein
VSVVASVKDNVVLFKGPEDGLVVTVTSSEPCPSPGYSPTDRHDRLGRVIYEWTPQSSTKEEQS